MIRRAHDWAFTHFLSRSAPQKAHRLGLISLAGRCAPTRGLTRPTLGRLDAFRHPTRSVDGAEVPLTIGAGADRSETFLAVIFFPGEASRALQHL